ncbi:glutaredoxin family protein [Sphaerobacter thermophilus]|uniref:glutaredoxin family protein n=1 Tax=Sphaerobacter thermophilus TaxID=2057 RepID=UPI0039C432E2
MPSAPPVVVLYSQTGCTDSARVRAWLTAQQIPFVERNVTEDAAAAAALAATGIFATPLLVVGGRQVFGFRPQAIADALRAAGLPLDSH